MPELAALHDYEQQKFAIADVLRSASVLANSRDQEWGDRLRDLFKRLAEDRFNLVVVGRFSRGKTSLMNAILTTDRLPTGIVPITSVITSVGYGSKEKVIIEYKGSSLNGEISLEQLPQYITQQGNPGNVRGIKLAEVQLPVEILRRGFYFVDTPGLGSAIEENTRTTEEFLPEADAFVLVTSYDSPLSGEEMRFIKCALPSSRQLFVVVNKHDTVSLGERENGLDYVREQIAAATGAAPRLFSVSARNGLEAKLCQDRSRLPASGIPALEQELTRFLLARKETVFLTGARDRVTRLLCDLPPSQERERLLDRMHGLTGEVCHDAEVFSGSPPAGPSNSRQQLRPCEICAQVFDAQHSFLKQYQYDFSFSEDAQRRLAGTHGFCSFHTRQFEAISSQAGMCMGYPLLFEGLAAELRELASIDGNPASIQSRLHELMPATETCMLCSIRSEAETKAISAVANKLSGDGAGSLSSLSIICFPHLLLLSYALPNSELISALLVRQAKLFERFAEDMRRYALKWDAMRRFLMSGEEMAAAEQAISALVGHRQVGFIWSSMVQGHERRDFDL
jgi:small GTP-binding protein